MASSALYSLLFFHFKLYGEAALQWAFVILAGWGWWRWLRPTSGQRAGAGVSYMSSTQRARAAVVTLAAWPLLGRGLSTVTDSDVPYLDALATVASLFFVPIVFSLLHGRSATSGSSNEPSRTFQDPSTSQT